MRTTSQAIFAAICLVVLTGNAWALEKVRTYTQTNYPGFVQYVAKELGLFNKYGIDPELRYFPSGAPIVQAAAAREWDVAFLGAPPAVVGSTSLGIVTIGIIFNESSQHVLIGRPDYVAAARSDPKKLKGAKLFVTTLSTGHYMTEACLRKLGIANEDVAIIPSDQTASVAAFSTGQGDLVQVWPPFAATLLERGNQVLCDGEIAGARIATVWVAMKEFANKHPDLVVRWLQANGEAIDWIKQDTAKTEQMYRKFMAFSGQSLTDGALRDTIRFIMTAETLKSQIGYLREVAPVVWTAPRGN